MEQVCQGVNCTVVCTVLRIGYCVVYKLTLQCGSWNVRNDFITWPVCCRHERAKLWVCSPPVLPSTAREVSPSTAVWQVCVIRHQLTLTQFLATFYPDWMWLQSSRLTSWKVDKEVFGLSRAQAFFCMYHVLLMYNMLPLFFDIFILLALRNHHKLFQRMPLWEQLLHDQITVHMM